VPWKLIILVFLAAAVVMALGPMAMYLVGVIIGLAIVGLLLTLTVTGLFSARQKPRTTSGTRAGADDSKPKGAAG
jgi:hypothetical protein